MKLGFEFSGKKESFMPQDLPKQLDLKELNQLLQLEKFSEFIEGFSIEHGRGPTRLETWIASSVMQWEKTEILAMVEAFKNMILDGQNVAD